MLAQITRSGAPLQASIEPDLSSGTAADLLASWQPTPEDRLRGLYVHVPFCVHKCHYCDFYSIVDSQDRREDFVRRALGELEAARRWVREPVEAIFFGGGTPTMLPVEAWSRIGPALDPWRDADTECTVEANPETIDAQVVAALRTAGMNRISLGVQSFEPGMLRALERRHDPESVPRAVGLCRAGGMSSLNLDLIFGVPGQDLDGWRRDLDRALALEPDHLSCYGLIYEPNTPLTQRWKRGDVERIDQDLEAEMYEHTIARLDAAGFEQYEISNWARPGHRCRHNLLYWTGAAWWPIGPSASGHAGGWRWRNVPRLGAWLASGTPDALQMPPIESAEHADDDMKAGEGFMMGLRLMDGMPRARVEALLAAGSRADARAAAIEREVAEGRLEWRDDALRLTPGGMMVADLVMGALL